MKKCFKDWSQSNICTMIALVVEITTTVIIIKLIFLHVLFKCNGAQVMYILFIIAPIIDFPMFNVNYLNA